MLSIQKRSSNTFLALLSLPATAMGFALSVQISALSWLLSTKYGLDIHKVGIVWAAGPIAGIFGQVIIGIISDSVWFWNGRRRPFIIIGGTLAALMLLALPNIDIINAKMGLDGILGVAVTVALLLDLSINISFNPTRSIIADVTSTKFRTKGYTWMQTISGSFGVLAYGIGAIFGKFLLIYLGVALVFAFSVFPCLLIEEPRALSGDKVAEKKSPIVINELVKIVQPLWGLILFAMYKIPSQLIGFSIPGYAVEFTCMLITIGMGLYVYKKGYKIENDLREFQKILFAHGFTWLGVQTMFIYIFAYINDQLPIQNDNEVGTIIDISFLLLNLVGALLPVIVLEPLTRKLGRVKTHTLSILVMAISYGLISFFGKTVILLYALMILAGIGWAATVSLPFAIMSERINKAKMGLFMGIFNLSVVLPQLVASLWVGDVVEKATNKSIVFIICAVSLTISGICWYFIRENQSHRTEA